jgi:HK97 family phage prohead protease
MECKLEKRILASAELRASESKAGGRVVAGYAATFGSVADIGGAFTETIRPGAFSRTLAEGCDCRMLLNHNPDQLLGRTVSKTLSLAQDRIGLKFACTLPDTSAGRDAFTSVQRGDLSGCSFAFRTYQDGEYWPSRTARELLAVELFDCSLATYPAYSEGTSVSARSAAGPYASIGVYRTNETAAITAIAEEEIERLKARLALARAL